MQISTHQHTHAETTEKQKLLKDIGADLPSIIQSDPFTLSSSALILFSKPCPSNPSHRRVLQNSFHGSVSAGSTLRAAVLKAQGHGRCPGKGSGIPCFPGRTHSLSPGLHSHLSPLKLVLSQQGLVMCLSNQHNKAKGKGTPGQGLAVSDASVSAGPSLNDERFHSSLSLPTTGWSWFLLLQTLTSFSTQLRQQ